MIDERIGEGERKKHGDSNTLGKRPFVLASYFPVYNKYNIYTTDEHLEVLKFQLVQVMSSILSLSSSFLPEITVVLTTPDRFQPEGGGGDLDDILCTT